MRKWKSVALALALAVPGGAFAQQQDPQAPQQRDPQAPRADFTLEVWAYFEAAALEEFKQRVQQYVELRQQAGSDLPPRRVSADPAEIRAAEAALAARIQAARRDAGQGEIFVPPIESGIKRLLVIEADEATIASISTGNPGEFPFAINSRYPEGMPLSTVPPNILALLPLLADGLEYRFIGRHLILRDSRADVIVDHIPYALECSNCPEMVQGEDDAGEETD